MLYHANDAWLLSCGVSTQDVLAAVEAEHSQITELSYRIQGEVQCLQTTGLGYVSCQIDGQESTALQQHN